LDRRSSSTNQRKRLFQSIRSGRSGPEGQDRAVPDVATLETTGAAHPGGQVGAHADPVALRILGVLHRHCRSALADAESDLDRWPKARPSRVEVMRFAPAEPGHS
jgi:hypothetical protein